MSEDDIWATGHWLNEPRVWRREPDGSAVVAAEPHSDFWRLTHDGGIRHNGHLYAWDVAGDCTMVAAMSGAYADLYHQAGIMACVDEAHWVKAGVEVFEGSPRLGCVVTNERSDWSLGTSAPWEVVWVRLQRMGPEIAVSYSGDGAAYSLARQCTLAEGPAQVGLFCCAPGETGFVATFHSFSLSRS
jgi:hypothetical protein